MDKEIIKLTGIERRAKIKVKCEEENSPQYSIALYNLQEVENRLRDLNRLHNEIVLGATFFTFQSIKHSRFNLTIETEMGEGEKIVFTLGKREYNRIFNGLLNKTDFIIKDKLKVSFKEYSAHVEYNESGKTKTFEIPL